MTTALVDNSRSDDASTTPADRELLELADGLNIHERLIDIAKVITDLGAFPSVATLVVAVSLLLAARRNWVELATFVLGSVAIYASVQLTKSGIDRPRPSGPLVDTRGASFPSGHAAYSTVWAAAAVVVARVVPGVASRTALVGGALVLAAAIGLSRMYLRVHYWSDVAGGWGLGAGVFGACAVIALIVSFVRHNDGDPDADRPDVDQANAESPR